MRASVKSIRDYFAGEFGAALGVGFRQNGPDGGVYDGVRVRIGPRGPEVVAYAVARGSVNELVGALGGGGPTHLAVVQHPALVAKSTLVTNPTLDTLLPGANRASTAFQLLATASGTYGFALRQETLNALSDVLDAAGCSVVDASLGPVGGADYVAEAPHGAGLLVGDFAVSRNRVGIALDAPAESPSPRETIVADGVGGVEVELPAHLLCALAGAVNLLRPARTHLRPEGRHLATAQRSAARVLVWGAGLAIVLAAGAAGAGTLVEREVVDLRASTFAQRRERERGAEVEALRHEREAVAARLGIGAPSRTGFYADRLASALPAKTSLVRLTVHPQLPPARRGGALETTTYYDRDIVELEGACETIGIYSDLIQRVDALDWVTALEHLDFNEDPSDGSVSFELRLRVAQN